MGSCKNGRYAAGLELSSGVDGCVQIGSPVKGGKIALCHASDLSLLGLSV